MTLYACGISEKHFEISPGGHAIVRFPHHGKPDNTHSNWGATIGSVLRLSSFTRILQRIEFATILSFVFK